MERWKKYLHKVLFPKLWIVFLTIPIATGFLIYVFANGYENSWIAYPIYIFSAYTLTILCARVVWWLKYARKEVAVIVDNQPVLHQYVKDDVFRLRISLYFSFGINVMYTILKFSYGFYLRSVWFGTLAVYYFLLAVMRFVLLRRLSRNNLGANRQIEIKWYMFCGVVLLFMNIALTGVVILVVHKNEGFEYVGYFIYVMAMYAFGNIVTAVRNMVKYRKYQSPVMSAAKVVSFTAALVSMLSLETAMLSQFNDNTNPERFRQIMTACTGGGVCVLIFGIAVYMIFYAGKELKQFKMEGKR